MIKLTTRTDLEIIPTSPFHFDPTFHKPDHFPSTDNYWEPGKKWQTMIWFGKKLGLIFKDIGTVHRPEISLQVFSREKLTPDFLDSFKTEIIYRYCLDLDLTEFNLKFRNDSHLGPIVRKWEGMRPMHYSNLYEHLIVMVMLQNCTIRRSVSMLQSLFEKYGQLLQYGGKELWCYWEPQDLNTVSEEELRSLKIGYRAKFVKRVSRPFADGEIDEFELRKVGREEQKQELLKLYGIGPVSVNDLLWEVFRHYDQLVKISPWQQKIYSKLFFNRDPESPVSEKKLLDFFERKFEKYQMLAIHYVWEDIWWTRKNKHVPWLEKLIRL
jgi:3-methyladenine DNA glycosylase/8-oxoguanine DNA glycosylase